MQITDLYGVLFFEAFIFAIGVVLGSLIVGISWSTSNSRIDYAERQRDRDADVARKVAETALIEAAIVRSRREAQ